MAGKDVVSQLLPLAQPFGTLSPPETRKLQKVSIVPADFLQREAASFIERHGNDPIVVWWSVDTTPLTIRKSIVCSLEGFDGLHDPACRHAGA